MTVIWIRIVSLLLCLETGFIATARIVPNPLPQYFTPQLIVTNNDTQLFNQYSVQIKDLEGMTVEDLQTIVEHHLYSNGLDKSINNSQILDAYNFLQNQDINIRNAQRDMLIGTGAKPYVHLASWQTLRLSCLSGGILSMVPWWLFGKDQMQEASTARLIVFILTASGLVAGPRLKLLKQLKNGEISISELDDPILNNKSSLKKVAVMLVGTCFIIMEGITLTYFTPSD